MAAGFLNVALLLGPMWSTGGPCAPWAMSLRCKKHSLPAGCEEWQTVNSTETDDECKQILLKQ